MKYIYKSNVLDPKKIIEFPEGTIILSTFYEYDRNNHAYQKVGHDTLGISWLEPAIDNDEHV